MRNSDAAVYAAIDRDADDAAYLDRLDAMVAGWLDQLIPELQRIRHPDARWQPEELVDLLKSIRVDLHGEMSRVSRGAPLVLEDAA